LPEVRLRGLLRVCGATDLQVQGVRASVQHHLGHAVLEPQAADARLPDGDRDLRERRQGRIRAPAQPRSDVQYKTAFVLAHKLREAMAAEHKGKVLRGHVEIDGAYFGGHVKPANRKADRVDRRLAEHQTGKRRCVVAMRERGGRTLPFVVISEDQAVPLVRRVVEHGSIVYADEAAGWDALHAFYDARRINHSIAFHDEGADTNQAESFFSRMRRSEIGQHHRIGVHLHQYAGEMAWREDNRRKPNGTQFMNAAGAALGSPVSRSWCGYWQRSAGHLPSARSPS
jgi:hypothetical protein